jgi:hypothetical protein
MSSIAFM